jgi:hypothetical protein
LRLEQCSFIKKLDIQERQEELVSIQEHCNNYGPSSNGKKKQKAPMTSQNKESLWKKSVYEIVLPSWIKKEIKTNSLKRNL